MSNIALCSTDVLALVKGLLKRELHITANLVARKKLLLYKALMIMKSLVKVVAATGILAVIVPTAQAQMRVSAGLHSSSGSCAGCDLSGKDMPEMTLKDANFTGSIFDRSNLSGGRISSTDMSETYFRKAFLVRVEGEKINFSKSQMQDVTLVEAKLSDSIFTNSDMHRADLARGGFIHSNFDNVNLTSASAPGADFRKSHFVNAQFHHANLREATLDEAIFKNVEFGNAAFHGASLKDTNFTGADLSQVRGLSQSQLDTACGDPSTQLPMGLFVKYCEDVTVASAEDAHKHDAADMPREQQAAALRLDRAVTNLEGIMAKVPPSQMRLRRDLQRVHADLMSARRSIEK